MPEAVIDYIRKMLNALDFADKVESDCFDPISAQNYHLTCYKVGEMIRLDIKHA
jgi:hypothetical protein